MSESPLRAGVRSILKVLPLWLVLMTLPFIERTLLGAKTYYLLYVGLALVFVLYGLTLRTLFFFLQHTNRGPVYVSIGFLLWSVFLCSLLAVYAFQHNLLPQTTAPYLTGHRPLIDYLYYEVITFTTVGYGDIIPPTTQGKVLAMCTALLGATHGVTFVAIVFQALSRPHPRE
jgi:ion channel